MAGLLTSFNVKYIDQALGEYRNSCDVLEPLVDKLGNHRLQARLTMSTKMQVAVMHMAYSCSHAHGLQLQSSCG